MYKEARELFLRPDVADDATLSVRVVAAAPVWRACLMSTPQPKWTVPDEEGLVQFLVREKGFKCAAE